MSHKNGAERKELEATKVTFGKNQDKAEHALAGHLRLMKELKRTESAIKSARRGA